MSERTISGLGGVCFLVILVNAFIVVSLVATERDELKQQAVERGCAEWVVKSNGSTTWQWKKETK